MDEKKRLDFLLEERDLLDKQFLKLSDKEINELIEKN